jgi:cytochrome b subunit of formate dehydrogenase
VLLKVLYWVAVVAVSVALVIGLILWFESRDASELEEPDAGSSVTTLA